MGNKQNQKSTLNKNQLLFKQLLPNLPQSYVEKQNSCIFLDPQHISVRQYIIMLNNDQLQSCIRSLNLRKANSNELIQIMYGQLLQDHKQYKKVKVYVEYIKMNLQQFINIHYSDLMPIFYKVFKGFKALYQQFGSFNPDAKMIGFNEVAQVKVWANIKYSKSKPQVSYGMLDEQKMVSQLVQIFSSKIDIGSLPIDSHRRKFDFKAKTFDQAIQLIQSQVQSVDLIPKSIKSIMDIFQSGRKIKDNQIVSMNSQFYHKGLEKLIKFKYSDPDLNQTKKQKVNFTFQGKSLSSPKKSSQSLPKINFTTTPIKVDKDKTEQIKTKVSFTIGNTPNESTQINNEQSKITINTNKNSNINITFSQRSNNLSINSIQPSMKTQSRHSNQIKNVKTQRSNSLIKFTYK